MNFPGLSTRGILPVTHDAITQELDVEVETIRRRLTRDDQQRYSSTARVEAGSQR